MKKAQGFSLIEVLAAVSLAAIVSITVLPKFIAYQSSAEKAKLNEIVAVVKQTAETYKAMADSGFLGQLTTVTGADKPDTYTVGTSNPKILNFLHKYPALSAASGDKFNLSKLVNIAESTKVTQGVHSTNQAWAIQIGSHCVAFSLDAGGLKSGEITDMKGVKISTGASNASTGECKKAA